MKRLFFVRHGETEMNVAGRWSGQSETTLTERGQKQAKKAGQDLKNKLPRIDLVICSPFSRAHDTAKIIASEIGYPLDKIETNELFIERAYGVLEGELNTDFYDKYSHADLDIIEGTETVSEMHDRAVKALAYLESLADDNILVVSHGTFGRAFRRVINKLPHTHEYDENHRNLYRIDNAEIVELI